MTKEETIASLRAYLDGDVNIGNTIQLRPVLESAIRHLSVLVPDDIQKAIDEYTTAVEGKEAWSEGADHFDCGDLENAIRFGAGWMASQGVTIEDYVCDLYDKLYLYKLDDCSSMTPDTSCEMLKEIGASKGEKVIVQIRKA